MTPPIMIEAGPSPYGWSRIGSFLRCPRLFYQREIAKVPRVVAWYLARGSICHAGLAQHFARIGAAQAGRDPLAFEDPHVAMGIVARETADEDVRIKALNAALEAYEVHRAAYPVEPNRIRAVELLLDTTFEGYPYTARLDLVWEDRSGLRWIVDHKIVAKIEDKAFQRYALSGQFLGLNFLGRRKWGDGFGGIMLNVIGLRDGKCRRREIEPAPYALSRFESVVVQAERRIAVLIEQDDPSAWPMAIHEQVCTSAYGFCDEFERCRWGCV